MDDYSASWREYRKRRNFLLFVFFGYVPIVGLVAVAAMRLFSTTTPAFVAAFTWMAMYAIAGIRFQRFKCPRCGKWFFGEVVVSQHVCAKMRPLRLA